MKFVFAIAAIGFLCPAWMGLGDAMCWFWTSNQCSNLEWDQIRVTIACMSTIFAIPCIGVVLS